MNTGVNLWRMIRGKRHTTRIGKRNQVTIPAQMLRDLGLGPGDRVDVTEVAGALSIAPGADAVAEAFGMLRRLGSVNEGRDWQEGEEAARRAHAIDAAEDDVRIVLAATGG